MWETEFAQMSIQNLEQMIAELEAETLNNGILWHWHEDPITRTDNQITDTAMIRR